MVSNRFHQKLMVDVVEEPLDIELQYPVIPPTSLAGDCNGLMSRFAGPITVRILMKIRVNLRLQHDLYHRLSYSIRNGRYSQGPFSP